MFIKDSPKPQQPLWTLLSWQGPEELKTVTIQDESNYNQDGMNLTVMAGNSWGEKARHNFTIMDGTRIIKNFEKPVQK